MTCKKCNKRAARFSPFCADCAASLKRELGLQSWLDINQLHRYFKKTPEGNLVNTRNTSNKEFTQEQIDGVKNIVDTYGVWLDNYVPEQSYTDFRDMRQYPSEKEERD